MSAARSGIARRWAGAGAVAAGVILLAGWAAGPWSISLAGFALCGLSLWLRASRSARAKPAATAAAALVLAIGAARLAAGAGAGAGLGLALALVLLGSALLLLRDDSNRIQRVLAGCLGGLTGFLGLLAALRHDVTAMPAWEGALLALLGSACTALALRDRVLPLARGRGLLAGFGLGLAVFLILSAVSYDSQRRLSETANWVGHTHDVLDQLESIRFAVGAARTSAGAYLITGREERLETYRKARQNLLDGARILRGLIGDNPDQQRRLALLDDLTGQRLRFLDEAVNLRRERGFDAASAGLATDPTLEIASRIERTIDEMKLEEKTFLAERETRVRTQTERTLFILSTGTFLGLCLLVPGLFFLSSHAAERRDAEAASRLAAEILRSTDDVVITTTLDGIVTSWNPGAGRFFGYAAGEVLGQPVAMFIPQDRQDEEREIRAKAARGDRVEHLETVRLRKNGGRANVSLSVAPLKDSSGRIAGAVKILRDITDRKQAEEVLRASEERLRALEQNAWDAVHLLSPDGEIVYESANVTRILGYLPEELLGRHSFELLHPDDLEEARARFAPLLAEPGSAQAAEVRVRHKDGSWRWMDCVATNLLDHPAVRAIAVNFRDITDRKRIEEERRESEERLNFALRVSQTGAWDLSLADRTVKRTEIHDRIFGYSGLLGTWTYGMFLDHVLPEDREEVDRSFQEATRNLVNWNFECRIRRADTGEIRWIWAAGGPAGNAAGGPAERMSGIVQDITPRKQAEEAVRASEGRYRALFESAPDGILIADPGSVYLDANASMCSMLGYSREELIGLCATDIVVPAEYEQIEPALDAIHAAAAYHREWRFRRKNGSVFAGEVIATRMPDGNIVAIVRDVTERKNAEQSLRDKDLQLHAADRRMAEIVNGMNEACFALDRDWRFSFVNGRTEALLRQSADAMRGHSMWEAFPRLAGSPIEDVFRRTMTDRTPTAFEAFSEAAGRWLDVRLFPTADGMAAFLMDIDPRKRAEEALKASEARYRRLFESAKDGILIADGETGLVMDVNPFLVSMLGCPRERFLRRAIWELEIFENAEADLADARVKEYLRLDNLTLETGAGERIEVEFTANAYLADGVRVLHCNVRDVSARVRAEAALRESEARYRTLFEYAPDGIVVSGATGRYVDANAAMCRMTGYTREELLARQASDLVMPDEIPFLETALGVIRDGHDYHRQWRFLRKDGSSFTAEVVATQMPDGNPVGMIRDISERKLAERRLEMRNAVSRVLAEAKSLSEAAAGVIRAICESELWEFGSIWEVGPGGDALRCADVWHRADFPARRLEEETRKLAFSMDEGLPGRVWASGAAHWIPEVAVDSHYLRKEPVAAAGLRSALAFPVLAGDKVTGVMDFAARGIAPPDAQLLEMFLAIGRQVGQFFERQRAEEALREGEARFRTMANSIPQLAWIARSDGFIEWYNERWYEYTGTVREEMEGWGWRAVLDPAIRPEALESWIRAIGRGEPFEMEFSLRGADGKLRAFLTLVHPLKDAAGRVAQWFGTHTNVEELKRMEASLRDSQARLHSTLSAGLIGTWTWDIRADCLRADPFTACMFSIDPEAAADGLPAAEYLKAVLEEDRAGVSEALQRAIDVCGAYDIEYRVRRGGQELHWLQAKGRVEADASGNASYFHGAVIDITERKRIEGRFRRLVDSNAQGVTFWNAKGEITEANGAFLRMTGYSREDLQTGRLSWIAMTPPEFALLDLRSARELAERGICAPYEKEYIRKDGSRVPVLLGAAAFEDNPEEGVCFLIDIAERKAADRAIRESEEHFRLLNDLSEATGMLEDPAEIMAATARLLGERLRVSRCAYADVEPDCERFEILYDYTDGCESSMGPYRLSRFGPWPSSTVLGGRTFILRDREAELAPGEGWEMFHEMGVKAMIACPLIRDGGLRAMLAVHQSDPRDWTPAEVTIVRDVAARCWATVERRTAEERIRQLNASLEQRVAERTAQLEAANKELEAFSYSVSHDLRAPLRTMDGFSQAVMEDYGSLLPPEGLRDLQTIRDGAQRMGTLIDDLLDFARLSRQRLNLRRVDMEKLVREAIEDLAPQREGRRIEIRTGVLPSCQGDMALLKQVWINLLSNAFKYSRKREIAAVEIGCAMQDGEAVYFVRDNGTGFDMKYAHKLFGVFQRLHRAEDYEGTGVGLAIVQRVIHRHGGRVWAEASENCGATFYFTLQGDGK